MLLRTSLTTLALAAVAHAGVGIALNEAYLSLTSTDDQEFIELIGPSGGSLDGIVVCVVEGEGSNAGTLDDAFDLTGMTFQADGYFVLGNTAVGTSFPGELDLDVGSDNVFENGTETIYVIDAPDPSAILALLGTDVSVDDKTTVLPTLGTILDHVAPIDADVFDGGGDITYDFAQNVGPDGTFFPGGIFRSGDFPGNWSDAPLDFDDVANLDKTRTPGTTNTVCDYAWVDLGCGKAGTGGGEPFMVGTGDLTGGSSNSLDVSGALADASATLVVGAANIQAPFKGGILFPAPDFLIPLAIDSAGDLSLGFTWPTGIPAGAAIYFQLFVVDAGAVSGLSSTNGICAVAQ